MKINVASVNNFIPQVSCSRPAVTLTNECKSVSAR